MKMTIGQDALVQMLTSQVSTFIPDGSPPSLDEVAPVVATALERAEACFSKIAMKYFQVDGVASFDHLHSDQYAMFLYLASNAEFQRNGASPLATKIFLLNKALHGLDAYFSIRLPETFLFVHPVGTVLGNAEYGNFFCVYQNCTVGSTGPDAYPRFGEGVALLAQSAVIGASHFGDDVTVGAGSMIVNTNVESGSVVTGRTPDTLVRPSKRSVINRVFGATSES